MLSLIVRCAGVGAVCLVFFAAGGHQASAVQEPVEVPDSTWLTVGPMKLTSIEVTDGSYPCQGLIALSPLGMGNTGEFEALFQVVSVGTLGVQGTYALPKPGKPVLTLDLVDLQDELGPSAELQKATIKAKFKRQNGVDFAQLNFDLKFKDCDIPGANGTVPCQNARLTYKGNDGIRFEP